MLILKINIQESCALFFSDDCWQPFDNFSVRNAVSKSFNFRKFEATVNSPYQMIHVSQENAQFVKSHVQKELEEHGLIRAASSPELYVDLFVNLKMERQATGGHAGADGDGGSMVRGVSIYEIGTLTIKLNSAANNSLLWQQSRTIPLWKKKERKIKKRVAKMVVKIFNDFDPNSL